MAAFENSRHSEAYEKGRMLQLVCGRRAFVQREDGGVLERRGESTPDRIYLN